MAAVITTDTLGINHSSLTQLGNNGPGGNAQLGRQGENVYVNAHKGNLLIQQHDDLLAATGLDLSLLRTYNSQGQFTDDNGDNWRLNVHQHIKTGSLTGTVNTVGSTIVKVHADGGEHTYTYDASVGHYISTDGAGAHDTLSYDSGSDRWTWTDGTKAVTETYDGTTGHLISRTDNDGHLTSYTYTGSLLTSITDGSGQTTHFDYTGNNLTQIRTVSNSVEQSRVRYGYDASDRLSTVTVDLSPEDNDITDGNTYVTTYTYDGTSNRVASITSGDSTTVSFLYTEVSPGDWRIARVTDGSGNPPTTYTYDTANNETDVTDPLGHVTTYITDADGQLIEVLSPDLGSGRLSTVYTYDVDGNVDTVTDGNGHTVSYQYDAHGNVLQQQDSVGNTVTYRYTTTVNQDHSTTSRLDSETVYLIPDGDLSNTTNEASGGQTTRYVYDSEDHLRFIVSAEGRVSEHRYDANVGSGDGNRISTHVYLTDTYDISGLTESDVLTEAQLTTWLSTADKAQSQRTDYAYDFRANVSSSTVYVTLDSAGAGIVDGTQATTTYIYDQAGRLLETVNPDGTATTGDTTDGKTLFSYDGLGRLLTTTNALGQQTVTTHDDANNQVVTTLANGLASTRVYDSRGQLTSTSDADGATPLGETTYHYDEVGRLRQVTDATGVSTYNLYDDANRLIVSIDGKGAITEFIYDDAGNVIQTIEYEIWLNQTQLNSLTDDVTGEPADIDLIGVIFSAGGSNLISRSDNKNRITHTVFDDVNRPVYRVDAEGFITETRYDGAGQVTETIVYADDDITLPANLTVIDVSNAITADVTNDRHIQNSYNADGQIIATLDAESYLTTYQYDAGGRLTSTYRYANPATDINTPPALDVDDQVNYTFYNNRGQVNAELDSEGYLSEYAYDLNGNQTETIRYYTKANAYTGVETVDQLRPTAHANDAVTVTAYDELNRVSSVTTQTDSGARVIQTTTQMTYDNVGNVIQTDYALNDATELRTTQARYDIQGRLTQTLSGEGSVALADLLTANPSATQAEIDALWDSYGNTHAYDDAGRRISSTDALDQTTYYYYDNVGRLTHSVNADGEVTATLYNAFGQSSMNTVYTTKLSQAEIDGLNGGLVDSIENTGFTTLVANLSDSSSDANTFSQYDLRGAIKQIIDANGRTTENSYNAYGELTTQIQQLNGVDDPTNVYRTDQFEYDRRGRLKQTTEDVGGLNRITSQQVDAFGRVVQTTDGNGNNTTIDYQDNQGRIVTTQVASGREQQQTYDAYGRTLTTTDANGNVTTTSYEDSNRSVTITTAEGVSTTTTRNRHGEEIIFKDGNGNDTNYAYDKNGNLKTVTDALGNDTTTDYDNANQVTDITDANGTVTHFTYDAAGRTLTRTQDVYDATTNPDGLNLQTEYSYDGQGRTVTITDANGTVTQSEYDQRGQVTAVVVDPTGLALRTEYSYDGRGKTLTVTEGAGTADATTTEYQYDKLERRISERQDPGGLNITTTYSYDANDNVIQTIQGAGTAEARTTQFVYDDDNRLTYTINGLGHVTELEYDANANVISTIRHHETITVSGTPSISSITALLTADATPGQDQITRQIYDADNRLVYQINDLGYVTEALYDAAGNVIETVAYNAAINVNGLSSSTTVNEVGVLVKGLTSVSVDSNSATLYNDPVQPYSYIASATSETKTTEDLSVTADTVQQYATHTQSANVVNNAWTLSGTTLVSTAGLSLDLGAGYFNSDTSVTAVKATIYDSTGALVDTVTLAPGYTSTAAQYHTAYTYDECNNVTGSYQVYDGTRYYWNAADWAGEVNLAVGGTLPDDKYTVEVEVRDDAYPSASLNGGNPGADGDGTWVQTDTVEITVGTPTLADHLDTNISWSAATDPVATSTMAFQYRVAGSTGAWTTSTIDTDEINGIHSAVIDHSVDGNYDYQIIYKDSAGHILKTTSSSVTVAGISSSQHTATFDVYDLTTEPGSSITGYDLGSDPSLIDYVLVRVLDENDVEVTTAITTPAIYDNQNVPLNLSVGSALADDGTYKLEITKYFKDASTPVTDTLVPYEVGPQSYPGRLSTVSWNANTQPANTSAHFFYGVAGSGSYTEVVPTLNTGTDPDTYQLSFENLNGSYDYRIEYRDTEDNVTHQIINSFTVTHDDDDSSVDLGLYELNNPNQHQYQAYDANNRLAYEINALGEVTAYDYDNTGNVIGTTAYATAIDAQTINVASASVLTDIASALTVSADDRTAHTVYDAAGRAVYSIDALGYVTEHAYDATGQLSERIRHHEAITISGTPTLTSVQAALAGDATPAKDQTSIYFYDAAGRIKYDVDALGVITEHNYDATGKLVDRIAYSQAIDLSTPPTYQTITDFLPEYSGVDLNDLFGSSITPPSLSVDNVLSWDADDQPPGTTSITYAYALEAGGMYTELVPDYDAPSNTYSMQFPAVAEGSVYFYRITYSDDSGTPKYLLDGQLSMSGGTSTTTSHFSEVKDNPAQITHYVYDLAGRLVEETTGFGRPDAATTRYQYDAFGNQLGIIDPRGVELAETDSDWARAERQLLGYAELVADLTAGDADALLSHYTLSQDFDVIGRKTGATDALGNSTSTGYDAFGNITEVTDANAHTGYFYYDDLGRLSLQVDPAGYATQSVYDGFGNIIKTVTFANAVQGVYDASTVIEILDTAPGGTPPAAYLVKDAAQDQTNLSAYDKLNQTTVITDTFGNTDQYSYTAFGNVQTQTDKNGHVTQYEYDARGQQVKTILPITSGGNVVANVSAYDAFGNVVQLTEAAGLAEERVTQYAYDNNNRLIQTTEPEVLTGVYQATGNAGMVSTTGHAITGSVGYVTHGGVHDATHVSLNWPPFADMGSGDIKIVARGSNWEGGAASHTVTVAGSATSANITLGNNVEQVINPCLGSTDNTGITSLKSVSVYKSTGTGDHLIGSTSNIGSSLSLSTKALHFSGQPADAATMNINYWPLNDTNDISFINGVPVTAGKASILAADFSTGSYGYYATVYNSSSQPVNQIEGTFSKSGNKIVNPKIEGSQVLTGVANTPTLHQVYDSQGNLLQDTDGNGHTTYHYYDNHNRRIGTVDAAGYVTALTYDAAGNRLSDRTYGDALPDDTDASESSLDSLVSLLNVQQFRETTYRYDASNRLLSSATREVLSYDRSTGAQTGSLITSTTYDKAGQRVKDVDANGNASYYYFDKVGNEVAMVDASGYLTARNFDGNGNLIQQTRYAQALSATTLAGLSEDSDVSSLIAELVAHADSQDRVVSFEYDGLNRLVGEHVHNVNYQSVTSGTLNQHTATLTTAFGYDAVGNLITMTEANGSITGFEYDGLNRQTLQSSAAYTDANSATVQQRTATAYDGLGNVLSETRLGTNDSASSDDQITQFVYDDQGNVITQTNAEGHITQFYYDLNSNLVAMHEGRINPDGALAPIDTWYEYDTLNQQITTEDADGFRQYARYNAYGDIVSKGLNGIEQEYFIYDDAGRLVKTNQDDGVDTVYLYDANGNATAKIISLDSDPLDGKVLKETDLAEFGTMSNENIQRTESEYDANNQRIGTYEAPIVYQTTNQTGTEDVWVDGLGDPFTGGTVSLVTNAISAQVSVISHGGTLDAATLKVNWSQLADALGDGKIRVVASGQDWGGGAVNHNVRVGTNATSASITLGNNVAEVLNPCSTGAVQDSTGIVSLNSIAVYKETPYGDILIGEQTVSGLGSGSHNINLNSAEELHLTGQPADAETLELFLWPDDSVATKPAVPTETLQRYTLTDNTEVAGWFVADVAGYAAGTYHYEYTPKDSEGNVLDTVRGRLTMGSNGTVLSQEIFVTKPVFEVGGEVTNVIHRQTQYNAFGDVVTEIDGRGYSTTLDYDVRGNLIRKTEPQVDVTKEDGTSTPHNPVTEYYYDITGRELAKQDANSLLYGRDDLSQNVYDAAGNVIQEINADNTSKQHAYDVFGNRVSVTNENGHTTTYTYNKLNQLTRMDLPTDGSFNNVTRFETFDYDLHGRRISRTNANGHTEHTYYDDIGRVIRNIDFGGIATEYRYTFDEASGGTTKTTTISDGKTLVDTTDKNGNLIYHKDLGGRTYNYDYNAAGLLIHQESSAGQDIDYEYYYNGLLKAINDAGVDSRTIYHYDANGNRTGETYKSLTTGAGEVYYQKATANYDALNRLVSIDDARFDIDYAYDAVGNRMHVDAEYTITNSSGGTEIQTQDYWYKYDEMNRFVVTKGELDSGVIEAGSSGYEIGYTAAGQRGFAKTYTAAGALATHETYQYNNGGLLTKTTVQDYANNKTYVANRQTYDAVGNVKYYYEQRASTQGGALTLMRSNTTNYNANNRATYENNTDNVADTNTSTNYYYDTNGDLSYNRKVDPGQTVITTWYRYEYWDTAKQNQIKISGDVTAYEEEYPWKPGFSHFTYDVNGHIVNLTDTEYENGAGRQLLYKTAHDGRILARNELIGAATTYNRAQKYYYFNDTPIGDAGTFGASQTDYATQLAQHARKSDPSNRPVNSTDFDSSFIPINDNYPSSSPTSYTLVSQDIIVGDYAETLKNVALKIWGDSSLWYLLADANGLQAGSPLAAGQNLVIPNVVTNVHNNVDTFKVYSPGQQLGDVNPTLPDAPPSVPVVQKSGGGGGCGFLSFIIIIVVAVVTYGASLAASAALGATAGAITTAGAIIGAAVGALAGQIVGNLAGVQDGFDFGAIAVAALTAGVTKGLGLSDAITGADGLNLEAGSFTSLAVSGAVNNASGQGIRILTGQQESFDWAGVAVAAISAPITNRISKSILGEGTSTNAKGQILDSRSDFAKESPFTAHLVDSVATGLTRNVVDIVVRGGGKIDWGGIAVDSIRSGINGAFESNDIDRQIAQQNAAFNARNGEASAKSSDDATEGLLGIGLDFPPISRNNNSISKVADIELDSPPINRSNGSISKADIELNNEQNGIVSLLTEPEVEENTNESELLSGSSAGGPALNATTITKTAKGNNSHNRLSTSNNEDGVETFRGKARSPLSQSELEKTQQRNTSVGFEFKAENKLFESNTQIKILGEDSNLFVVESSSGIKTSGVLSASDKELDVSIEAATKSALVIAGDQFDTGIGSARVDVSSTVETGGAAAVRANRHGVIAEARFKAEAVALQASGSFESKEFDAFFFNIKVQANGDLNAGGLGGALGGGGALTRNGGRVFVEAGLTPGIGARGKFAIDVKFNHENISDTLNKIKSFF